MRHNPSVNDASITPGGAFPRDEGGTYVAQGVSVCAVGTVRHGTGCGRRVRATPRPGPRQGSDRDRDRSKWELLGTQAVDFRGGRDVINVGRREGRFTRIALEARDHDIFIRDLKVIFLNNEVQDIPVRAQLRRDQRTRPLDLTGDDRVIRQVQIVYRARPGFGGYALLRLYGEKDRGGGSGAGRALELGAGSRPGPAQAQDRPPTAGKSLAARRSASFATAT